MKVIITNRFKNKYLKLYSKYFSKEDFAKTLHDKSHTFISLHDPFLKFKNNINSVAFRGVLVIIDNKIIIPLFLFLKKDKNNGENINWKEFKEFIETEYNFSVDEISKGNFEEL